MQAAYIRRDEGLSRQVIVGRTASRGWCGSTRRLASLPSGGLGCAFRAE